MPDMNMQDRSSPGAQICAASAIELLAEHAQLGELLANACLPALVQLLQVSGCLGAVAVMPWQPACMWSWIS